MGAVPATIAIFGGEAFVGLDEKQLEHLSVAKDIRKASTCDLPIAVAKKLDCATTVSTTAYLAHRAGIKVFATGGIGGVHRGNAMDISADLPELARTPIVVVCSGAKIVLDLPRTRNSLKHTASPFWDGNVRSFRLFTHGRADYLLTTVSKPLARLRKRSRRGEILACRERRSSPFPFLKSTRSAWMSLKGCWLNR